MSPKARISRHKPHSVDTLAGFSHQMCSTGEIEAIHSTYDF